MMNECPTVVLVLPAYNEAGIIVESIHKAHAICGDVFKQNWKIIIVDNGSTDGSSSLVLAASRRLSNVSLLELPTAGKGAALSAGWEAAVADIYFFTDADLSADLAEALPKALDAFVKGATVVVGSRFLPNSIAHRSLFRQFISRSYHLLSQLLVGTKLTDLPCGFKAVTRQARDRLLPQVKSMQWFFDSELLLIAEATKEKIAEVPVIWEERKVGVSVSTLPIVRTSVEYTRELLLLRPRLRRLRCQIQK